MPNIRRAREDNEEENEKEEVGVNKRRRKQEDEEIKNESIGSSSSNEPIPEQNKEDLNEGELNNPNRPNEPRTPTLEEYTWHQITHYPSMPWCPTCVKNAAVNNTHKKTNRIREAETFSLDYMFMSKSLNVQNYCTRSQ